jgi:hypothetical protein
VGHLLQTVAANLYDAGPQHERTQFFKNFHILRFPVERCLSPKTLLALFYFSLDNTAFSSNLIHVSVFSSNGMKNLHTIIQGKQP